MKNKFNLYFVLSILFHVCFAVSNEFKIKNITLISNHYLIIAAILLIIICSNDKFTSDHSIWNENSPFWNLFHSAFSMFYCFLWAHGRNKPSKILPSINLIFIILQKSTVNATCDSISRIQLINPFRKRETFECKTLWNSNELSYHLMR